MDKNSFNILAENAVTSLLVDDFEALREAAKQLRRGTPVGVRDRGRIVPAEFVAIQGDRLKLRDTALTWRMLGKKNPRPTTEVHLYEIVAVPETKFKRPRR